MQLPAIKGRKIEIDFKEGEVTSDGGILLLNQVDHKLGLTEGIAKQFHDKRDQSKIKHSLLAMLYLRLVTLIMKLLSNLR